MNNKIIGFTISEKEIDHGDVDVFKSRLSTLSIKRGRYNIYLWGIGNLKKCFINSNVISLSFPLVSSLSDRNALITFKSKKIYVENDWLGSIPIFYNKKDRIISTLYNKVQRKPIEISNDGLHGYLDFGYSVFETSPVKNVKILRYFSKIIVDDQFSILKKKDIFLDKLMLHGIHESVKNVINTTKKYLHNCEGRVVGNIIIPTSGGYDSRFLNSLISNKSRVRSFTYGLSFRSSSRNVEVVKAKYITKKLSIWWKEIRLGHFLKYYQDWHKIFGLSTHLHGMYHIEFYKKIKKMLYGNQLSVLSGIFGDVWGGNVVLEKINNYKGIWKLGYTHNLRIDPSFLLIPNSPKLYKIFFTNYKKYFSNEAAHTLILIRIKIILISYLMSIPDYLGLPSWTPFLSYNVVSKILFINPKERKNRLWQDNYFKKIDLYPESQKISFLNVNTLDFDAIQEENMPNINILKLSKYLSISYLLRVFVGYWRLKYLRDVKYMWAFNSVCILKNLELII